MGTFLGYLRENLTDDFIMIEKIKTHYVTPKIPACIEIHGTNISEGDIKKVLSTTMIYAAQIYDESGRKLLPRDLPINGIVRLKTKKIPTETVFNIIQEAMKKEEPTFGFV